MHSSLAVTTEGLPLGSPAAQFVPCGLKVVLLAFQDRHEFALDQRRAFHGERLGMARRSGVGLRKHTHPFYIQRFAIISVANEHSDLVLYGALLGIFAPSEARRFISRLPFAS